MKLVAGGDVMIGRQMHGFVGRHGAEWPFEGIAESLRSADLGMVNLETAVATVGDFFRKGGRRPTYFRAHPEMLDVLVAAGVRILCAGNDHSMDFGPEALTQQCELLDACGFVHFGAGINAQAAAAPAFARVRGIAVAFVGVETESPVMAAGPNRPGIMHARGSAIFPAVSRQIAVAREQADVVIVSPHWGKTWADAPTAECRELARALVDAGADAILGHSARVLQGVELYRGRPIVYDMGSLLFDRVAQGRMRYSALFELDMTERGIERLRIVPVLLSRARASLATGLDAAHIRTLLTQLSLSLDPALTFVRVDEMLCIECASQLDRHHPSRQSWPACDAAPRLPDTWRNLRSNVVHREVPVEIAWEVPVPAARGLTVLGARIAPWVRTGRGFVCEIWFRASAPQSGRWEARLAAVVKGGDEIAFVYDHPVSGGAWPPSFWDLDDVIVDRCVVRPHPVPPAGRYHLYWQLVDRERRQPLRREISSGRRSAHGVYVGDIEIDDHAPRGVAGIAFPLPPPGRAGPRIDKDRLTFTLGGAVARREGWQCHVLIFKNHVLKVLKSDRESWATIRRQSLNGRPDNAFAFVRSSVEPSIALIKDNAVPPRMVAYFEVIGDGIYLQARGRNLGEVVARLLRREAFDEVRALFAHTADFIVELWRYGVSETSWKLTKNFGVLATGELVLLDCLELTGDQEKVAGQIRTRRWIKKNARFIANLPSPLGSEFAATLEKRLSLGVLEREWRGSLQCGTREDAG